MFSTRKYTQIEDQNLLIQVFCFGIDKSNTAIIKYCRVKEKSTVSLLFTDSHCAFVLAGNSEMLIEVARQLRISAYMHFFAFY